MKFLSFLIFAAIFWLSHAQAKVLVVSDIDDTIKISHVVDTADSVVSAVETYNVFLGMSDLYRVFQSHWGKDAEILYLSNAPAWLMEDLHREFLQQNKFPKGQLSLVSFTESTADHKLNQIRAKLKSGRYQTVLLIGDNGERDPFIYAHIQKEYPNLKVKTFIHQLYSVKAEEDDYQGVALQENQIGFVTPIEIMLELGAEKILPEERIAPVIDSLSRFIQKTTLDEETGEIMFPVWEDCRDFHWKWESQQEEVRQLKSFVLNRCAQNPEENELWRLSKIVNRK